MARTGENIRKRKDGRFEGRYIAGRGEGWKILYKSVYGYSKAEVRQKLEEARHKMYGMPSPTDGMTFKQVAEEYIKDAKGRLASTTCDRYVDILERDVYPEYANTPMSDVTEAEVKRFLKIAPVVAGKKGRSIEKSSLYQIRAVMCNVINFARNYGQEERADLFRESKAYEELSPNEIEMICIKAKSDHDPHMLAALLGLFCGLRVGEICALQSEDINTVKHEIRVSKTTRRVKNPKAKQEEPKTIVVVEEITRKKQIRNVNYPEILQDFIEGFLQPDSPLIRAKDDRRMESRSLERLLIRTMEEFRLEGINFERLRKTYRNGKADEKILKNIFQGIKPKEPYKGILDKKWLMDEMANDLFSLRHLLGFSVEEIADILGMSDGMYRQFENGKRGLSWDQYMSFLFMFYYNPRTKDIVNSLGLYPYPLREKIKIGE